MVQVKDSFRLLESYHLACMLLSSIFRSCRSRDDLFSGREIVRKKTRELFR
jgi:hypothetical protein